MASNYSAPGVYRKLKDISDVMSTTGVSNGGIVIRSRKGPIRRPVLVSNTKEFIDYFGEPYFENGITTTGASSYKDNGLVPELGYGSYAALNFLEESDTLYVVRAYDENTDIYSSVGVSSTSATPIFATSGTTGITPISATDIPDIFDTRYKISSIDNSKLDSSIMNIGYISPGADGNNYAVTIETLNPYSDWIYDYDEYPMDAWANVVPEYNNNNEITPTTSATIWYSGYTPDIDTTSYPYEGGVSAVEHYFPIASKVVKVCVYEKPSDVSWGDLYATSADNTDKIFRLEPIETFYGTLKHTLDVNKNDLSLTNVINGNSQYIYVKCSNSGNFDISGGWDFDTAQFSYDKTQPDSATGRIRRTYPSGVDDSGSYVFSESLLKLTDGKTNTSLGEDKEVPFWSYFESREELPVQILVNPSNNTKVKQAVAKLAHKRLDCIGTGQSGTLTTIKPEDVIASETYGYPSPAYMALYAGYSLVYDQYNSKNVYLPNAIFGASTFARVDRLYEPWTAPAGVNNATLSVLGQLKVYDKTAIGRMYDRNINTVKYEQGAGFAIWGQKTAQLKKTALDRINVVRNIIYIQNNIESFLNQFLFEKNTENTRLRAYSSVDGFLSSVKAGEGLYDYSVVCDETNNTDLVIDSYQMNIDIYIQPVKTMEFIQFTTVVTRTGVSFGDVQLQYA